MHTATLSPFFRRFVARSTIAVAAGACLALASCESLGYRFRSPITKVEKELRFGPGKLTADALQSEVMSFADTFQSSITEAWNQVAAGAREAGAGGTLDAEEVARLRSSALQNKLASASAALSIASSPNPTVALADMITLITLQHAVLESPASVELYGAEASARLAAAYKTQEEKAQRIAERAMSQKQRDELATLIADWLAENPDARYVSGVRLEDFARTRQQSIVSNGGSSDSLLALVALDPLSGLDPTQREVQRSRMLGERVFYFTSRWPHVLKWHVETLYQGLLGAPEVEHALAAVTRVSGAVEGIREQVATERAAALEDFFTRLATERRAALVDVSVAVDAQRSALVGDLDRAQGKLQETLADVKETVAVTSEAASELTQTFEAASALTSQFRKRPESPADDAEPKQSGLAAYHAAVAETGEAATRVSELVRDVDEKRVALSGVLLDARHNAEGVIAYAAQWLIAVIAATVALVTTAIVLYRRIARARTDSHQEHTVDRTARRVDRPAIT